MATEYRRLFETTIKLDCEITVYILFGELEIDTKNGNYCYRRIIYIFQREDLTNRKLMIESQNFEYFVQ